MSHNPTTEAALASIPKNYRFYTADASIKGRVSVMLALCGQDEEDWFLSGEVLDSAGRDVRPELYVTGSAATLPGAIAAAVEAINNGR